MIIGFDRDILKEGMLSVCSEIPVIRGETEI
jgi:hypothetical protein